MPRSWGPVSPAAAARKIVFTKCGIVEELKLIQERQQLTRWAISAAGAAAINRRCLCEDLLSQREICIEVHLCGFNGLVLGCIRECHHPFLLS